MSFDHELEKPYNCPNVSEVTLKDRRVIHLYQVATNREPRVLSMLHAYL